MAAGRHGPAEFFLYVDGYNLTAAKLSSFNHDLSVPMVEALGLGDSWKERTPLGVQDVALVQEGAFFDTRAGLSHEALSGGVPASVQAVERIVSFGYAGNGIGDGFFGVKGTYSHKYQVASTVADLQRANAEYSAKGPLDEGRILQPLEVKTADWNTESAGEVDHTEDTAQRVVPIASSSVANPSIITTTVPHGLVNGQSVLIAGHAGSTPDINGEHIATVITPTTFSIPVNVTVGGTGGTLVQANTLNGGVGYLQVTAFTGFTGFVGKIRDSADDVTYADLITFANVTTAPAKERLTVAGLVDRYLAFDGNLTGTGSLTVFCGFARS